MVLPDQVVVELEEHLLAHLIPEVVAAGLMEQVVHMQVGAV
jgi:hypothetical protein